LYRTEYANILRCFVIYTVCFITSFYLYIVLFCVLCVFFQAVHRHQTVCEISTIFYQCCLFRQGPVLTEIISNCLVIVHLQVRSKYCWCILKPSSILRLHHLIGICSLLNGILRCITLLLVPPLLSMHSRLSM